MNGSRGCCAPARTTHTQARNAATPKQLNSFFTRASFGNLPDRDAARRLYTSGGTNGRRCRGRVRITTTDARAPAAVHALLRYQTKEHATGDTMATGNREICPK